VSRVFDLAEQYDAISRVSVVEILGRMRRTLELFTECEHLSSAQAKHLAAAWRHVDAAIAEWVDEVLHDKAVSSSGPADDESPECPARGLDAVSDMLRIIHDMREQHFTQVQRQRIMIAAHNLLQVAQELMKSMH
jgi:hypothetical protein